MHILPAGTCKAGSSMKKNKYKSLKIIGAAALFYFLFVRARTAPVEEITESNITKALKKIYEQKT